MMESYCLETLNECRGSLPLSYDALVSEVAQAHAVSMARSNFLSHVGLDGLNAYQRYGLHGVRDHVVERMYGQEVGSETSDMTLKALISKARDAIMARGEKDAASADSRATHAGFGVSLLEKRFRYVEVIVFKYVELDEVSCPEKLLYTKNFTLSGTLLSEKYGPFAAVVYYDPTPTPTLDVPDDLFYDDFSEERVVVLWPWQFDFYVEDKSFSATFDLGERPPGTYYVQLFLRGDPATIPYDGEVENVEVPGPDFFCATGLVLRVEDKTSTDIDLLTLTDETTFPTASNEAEAQKDAAKAAVKPDGEPLAALKIVFDSLDDDWEMKTYGDGTLKGLAFKRLALEEIDLTDEDHDPRVLVDVALAGNGRLTEIDGELEVPMGYEILEPNLLNSLKLCACFAPASEAGLQAIVDLFVVYGAPKNTDDDIFFDVGGGFETVELPEEAAGSDGLVYVCFKREGAGRAAAEHAQERAQHATQSDIIEPETEESEEENSVESDSDKDESLLDASLTPAQVLEKEDKEADALFQLRAKAAKIASEKADERRKNDEEEDLQKLQEKKAELLATNADLQKKLAAHFYFMKERSNGENKAEGDTSLGLAQPQSLTKAEQQEAEKQYAETLSKVLELKRKAAIQKAESDRSIYELQSRLDEKEYKAKKIADSFREFKREIALSAEHSRTSKPIPRRVIAQFEELEAKKEAEVEKVRLKNINLRMTLKKLEAQLRAKEQLAEGLHLIDFEQLKIENQSLREKIDERDDELARLKKKNTQNVQVLTHVKEKLQFVQAQNQVDQATLADLDTKLAAERDRLTKLKAERDSIRQANALRKQGQGFANSDLLIIDYEKNKKILEGNYQTIEDLKHQYAIITAQNKAKAKRKTNNNMKKGTAAAPGNITKNNRGGLSSSSLLGHASRRSSTNDDDLHL